MVNIYIYTLTINPSMMRGLEYQIYTLTLKINISMMLGIEYHIYILTLTISPSIMGGLNIIYIYIHTLTLTISPSMMRGLEYQICICMYIYIYIYTLTLTINPSMGGLNIKYCPRWMVFKFIIPFMHSRPYTAPRPASCKELKV